VALVNLESPNVFFVHGIRNSADNYGEIYARWARAAKKEIYVEGIDYGFLTATEMWLAGLIPALDWRRRRFIARQLREARAAVRGPFAVIAHSKGTGLIVDTLIANPDIVLDSLVLVASVLSNKYNGSKLQRLIERGQVRHALVVWSPNDTVIRDLCPWPYGKLGATGFVDLRLDTAGVTVPVTQVGTQEDHSTYFWSEFRNEHFEAWTRFITAVI
jgi:alpha-beta hydrolase superfamily lysophospholipase